MTYDSIRTLGHITFGMNVFNKQMINDCLFSVIFQHLHNAYLAISCNIKIKSLFLKIEIYTSQDTSEYRWDITRIKCVEENVSIQRVGNETGLGSP